MTRRRQADAERVMDLDAARVQAAGQLRAAYFAGAGTASLRVSRYSERIDRQWREADGLPRGTDRSAQHRAWLALCQAQGKPVDIEAVHAVICEGHSCRTVDSARGRASYMGKWAAAHVRRGLDLWTEAGAVR